MLFYESIEMKIRFCREVVRMFEEKESFWQKKGFYFSACLLLVGVMAVGAICYRQANRKNTDKMMADIATEEPQETEKAAASEKEAVKAANAQVTPKSTYNNDKKTSQQKKNTAQTKVEKTSNKTKNGQTSQRAAAKKSSVKKAKTKETSANITQKKLSFNEESGLLWPVTGKVLLKYSMTNTVFFKTLAQYKCNPGIMIAAKEGTEVKAASDCNVTKISKDDEHGTLITTDIGDNYSVTYGQVDHLKVKKGDVVEEGKIIATVAKPTKYFTKEGANLYMQVTEGKNTVDPLFLLR